MQIQVAIFVDSNHNYYTGNGQVIPMEIQSSQRCHGKNYFHGVVVTHPNDKEADLRGVVFNSNILLCQMNAEDVYEQHKRCNKTHIIYVEKPICGIYPEWLRNMACNYPETAYRFARDVKGMASHQTRFAASQDPHYALAYARDVDKTANEVTRSGAALDDFCRRQYNALFGLVGD